MALTDEKYKALGEDEYMIDDLLVEASPISFGAYCEKYSFDSTEYDCDVKDMMLRFLKMLNLFILSLCNVVYLNELLLKVITDANEIF